MRRGEYISSFIFSMYLNDLTNEFVTKGLDGFDISMLKLYLLFYTDDVMIFSETGDGLQSGLNNILSDYCKKWKLIVNMDKAKVMIFRKGEYLPRNSYFVFNGKKIEIVKNTVYLGITFTTGVLLMKHIKPY